MTTCGKPNPSIHEFSRIPTGYLSVTDLSEYHLLSQRAYSFENRALAGIAPGILAQSRWHGSHRCIRPCKGTELWRHRGIILGWRTQAWRGIILAAWVRFLPTIVLAWNGSYFGRSVCYLRRTGLLERDTAGVKENTLHFLQASVYPCWLGRGKRVSESGRGGYGNSLWDFKL